MILKNKIITLLSIMALNIPTTGILAQEKTSFTLQDVIPGGDNYFNLIPKRMSGLKWWGDVCIRTGVEEIVSIDKKNGKEKTIITLEELNSALQADEKTKGIKQIRSLMGASMPWGEEKEILLSHNGNIIVYDFEDKAVKSVIKINKGAANIDFCKESMTVAYTVGDNPKRLLTSRLILTSTLRKLHVVATIFTTSFTDRLYTVMNSVFTKVHSGVLKENTLLSTVWTRVW